MNVTLEKVDQIKERTNASYKDIKEALENSNGHILEAIIYLEEKGSCMKKQENILSKLSKKSEELLKRSEVEIKKDNLINTTREIAQKSKLKVEQLAFDYEDKVKDIADNVLEIKNKFKGKVTVKKSRIDQLKKESDNEITIFSSKPLNDNHE